MGRAITGLASYLPGLVRRRLAATSAVPLAPYAETLYGALLFADITGSTALAERLAAKGPAGAEELGAILDARLGALVDEVVGRGGDVVKFAGDGLFAFWLAGSERDLPLAVHRAVACALRLQERPPGRLHAQPMALRIGV